MAISLPKDIFGKVLSYLSLKTIHILDNAICNRDFRQFYIECISENSRDLFNSRDRELSLVDFPEFGELYKEFLHADGINIFKEQHLLLSAPEIIWLVKRNVSVRSARITNVYGRGCDDNISKDITEIASDLVYLSVDGEINDTGLRTISYSCPNLKHLTIRRCRVLTGSFVQFFTNLITLNCDEFDLQEGDVVMITTQCPNLRTLKVTGLHIKEHGFIQIAQNCPELTGFGIVPGVHPLEFNSRWRYIHIIRIVINCRNLIYLKIGYPLSDQNLIKIAQHGKNLVMLSLRNCSDVTDAGLCSLISSPHRISILHMSIIPNVTDESARMIETSNIILSLSKGRRLLHTEFTLYDKFAYNYECNTSNIRVNDYESKRIQEHYGVSNVNMACRWL
jgi:hypothetical protein